MSAKHLDWHVVQNVRTGHYHVVRHKAGGSEDDIEFLCGQHGMPRAFANGDLAEKARNVAFWTQPSQAIAAAERSAT